MEPRSDLRTYLGSYRKDPFVLRLDERHYARLHP